MRLPSAIHPIRVAPFAGTVTVRLDGLVVGRSDRALALDEAGHRRVHYLPRADMRMERFARTERRTVCPFKGIAVHYSVSGDGQTAESAAWSYECPNPAFREIAGYLAFYPGRIAVETQPESGPAGVDIPPAGVPS